LPEQEEAEGAEVTEEAKQQWWWMGHERGERQRKDWAVTVFSNTCRVVIRLHPRFCAPASRPSSRETAALVVPPRPAAEVL
jgi:hypothetical protein